MTLPSTPVIRKLVFQSINSAGAPVYDHASGLTSMSLPGFPTGGVPSLFRYDDDSNRLFVHAVVPSQENGVCGYGAGNQVVLRWNDWPSSPTLLSAALPHPVHHRNAGTNTSSRSTR